MVQRLLCTASTHARLCLVMGLLAGLALPGLAAAMVPWLPHMVAGLLAITALRIGAGALQGALRDLGPGLMAVTALQLGLPLIFYGILSLMGVAHTPAALAVLLTTSAPAITGSVNLALMMRLDAGRMMQMLVLGTAVFPLTVLPVLALLPHLGPASDVIAAALRLLAVILVAACVGFSLRAWLFPAPTPDQIKALDGLSVLAFSGIVVGLMAALTPALMRAPGQVALWGALAFAISYGLQALALVLLRQTRWRPHAGLMALGAGNRNIAIFLIALPAEAIAPLMVFIGCWQLPMYLTPLLMPRLYRWALDDD